MAVPEDPVATRCYIHPQRAAGSVCRRCNKPICPDCMREAPVGWQCTKCVKSGARTAPVVRWRPSRPDGGGVGRGVGRLGNTRMTPVVASLIAVNVIIYIWEQSNFNNIVSRFSVVGYFIHYQHQWYRLITGAFLHLDFEHILLNMITLAIVGPPVEAELGRGRFLGLYWLCALGGSVGSYLLTSPFVEGIGASGAIFGLMGAYFVLARRNRWDINTIVALIVINLIFSFSVSGIDWEAHLGGLLTGALATLGLDTPKFVRQRLGASAASTSAIVVVVGGTGILCLLLLLTPGLVNL